jgi:hypothetical protein
MTTRDCKAWRTILAAVCALILILGVPALAQHQPIITTIDAPRAGDSNGYGTQVQEINAAGIITGFYVAYDNVAHGFVRSPDGHFTIIDGPGVPSSLPDSDDPFSPPSTWINSNDPGTYGAALDPAGNVAGYYVDANGAAHGFLQARDGKFTSFNVKDAGNQANQGTYAVNMNPEGTIAGYYVDAQGGWHGFVRTRDGAISPFEAPDGTGSTWTGWTACLNERGEVAGAYYDSNGNQRGFVRKPDGTFEPFAYQNSDQNKDLTPWSSQGTNIWAINAQGAVAGVYVDSNNVYHGLVRSPDGKIAVFDVPRAPKGADTIPQDINSEGAIVGLYNDAPDSDPTRGHHGFVRSADGRFTYFDVPVKDPKNLHGTVPYFINEDTITGFYIDGTDGNYVWHGFERKGADWRGFDWK